MTKFGQAGRSELSEPRLARAARRYRLGVTLPPMDVVARAAERVEAKYPALVGGVGVYPACCGHGPFTHVDVRGYRARWRGTGNG